MKRGSQCFLVIKLVSFFCLLFGCFSSDLSALTFPSGTRIVNVIRLDDDLNQGAWKLGKDIEGVAILYYVPADSSDGDSKDTLQWGVIFRGIPSAEALELVQQGFSPAFGVFTRRPIKYDYIPIPTSNSLAPMSSSSSSSSAASSIATDNRRYLPGTQSGYPIAIP